MSRIKTYRDVCKALEEHDTTCKIPAKEIGLTAEAMRRVLIDQQSELRGLTPKQAYAQLAGAVIPYVRIRDRKLVLLTPDHEAAGYDIAFFH